DVLERDAEAGVGERPARGQALVVDDGEADGARVLDEGREVVEVVLARGLVHQLLQRLVRAAQVRPLGGADADDAVAGAELHRGAGSGWSCVGDALEAALPPGDGLALAEIVQALVEALE